MTITDYRNFDLLITRSGDRYRAIVVESPAGEESAGFDLPAAAGRLSDLGGLVRGASRAMDPAPRLEAVSGPPSSLADLGQHLYTAIFPDKLSALLAASLSSVAEEGAGLRLRLRFEEDTAGLAILPWEILYDPAQAHFIGLGERSPILRYLALPRSRSALLVEPPLRVLAVLASPNDLPALDVEREWQAIQDALAGLTADAKFVLERLTTPTLAALQDRLLGEPVHILHFVGHGVFDEASQAGCLVLEDPRGRPQLVRGEQLAALLRNHPAMRLAYLNACEGALASGGSVFTGLAQTLVREGVPAAVAMQAEISDAGAVELARSFYTALAAGRPVDAALTQARVALSAADSPEWAIPVLFSRSPDNRLFDIRQVLPTPDCPYPGMTPFGEAQKDLFFGRDKEIEDAVERLRQHPFLTVIGPSGSGKSSLIYAGVIPALRRSKRFGPGAWDIKIMRPGDSRTADGKGAPMQALAQLLNLSLQAPAPDPQPPTFLFVDQFEETFTLAGADEAQAFLDALNGLIGRPNLHILLTVRADFYPELMASSLWQPIRANRLELTPLGDDELWAAIVEPAARVGVEVDEALAVKLIADASGQKGVLPLVQETLVLLWDKVKGRRLKLEAYKEMGESGRSGLQVAVDRRATTVYHNLPDAAQPIARRIFLRLIQFGEGRADTRRQQTTAELRASGDDPALFDQTLAKLTESRLLTASGDTEGAERRVDIAHEALIAGWPRLQAWLDQRRAAEQTRRRLEAKAAEWVAAEKRGGLLDEYELQEAENWLAGEDARELGHSQDLVDLAQTSKAKLDQAKAEVEAQRKRELEQTQKLADEQRLRAEDGEKATSGLRKRLIVATVAVVIAAIAFAAAAWFGVDASRQRNGAEIALVTATVAQGQAEIEAQNAREAKATAEANAIEAKQQKQEAEREAANNLAQSLVSQALAASDSELHLLLSIEAVRATYDIGYQPSAKVVGELQRAILDGPRRAAAAASSWATGAREITLDPRQRWIALQRGPNLGTGRLLSLSDLRPAPLPSGVDNVNEFYFSPKGALIAAIREKTVIVMDATTLEIRCEMPHSEYVNDAVFSPSEGLIFIATYGDASYLWDVSRCQKAGTIAVQLDSGDELDARFNESFPRLILFGRNRTEIWDISDPSLPRQIFGNKVAWYDINGNGTRLAVSRSGLATVLNVADGSVLCEGLGEYMVFLSPDGKYAATRQPWRAQISLWDIENCVPIREIQLIEGAVRGVHWLVTDGRLKLLVRGDKWTTIFDAKTGEMTASLPSFADQAIKQLLVDPHGRFLLLALDDGTVRLWNMKKNLFEQTFGHQIGSFDSMSFFPDGTSIATLDGTKLRIWDLPRDNPVTGLVMTPNALLMQIESEGKAMHLDDTHTGSTVLEASHETETIIATSADNRWLATSVHDEAEITGEIRIWDMADAKPKLAKTLGSVWVSCQDCPVGTLSNDGRWLALIGYVVTTGDTSVSDASIIPDVPYQVTAWDIANNRRLHLTDSASEAFPEPVAMALSPTGRILAIMDWNGMIELWNLADEPTSPIELPLGKTATVDDLDRIAFSSDGSRLIAEAWGLDSTESPEIGSLRVYDVQSHQLLREYDPSSADLLPGVVRFEFAPDGRSVFVVTKGDIGSSSVSESFQPGQQIERWEVDTLKQIGKTMTGHDGTVDALALHTTRKGLLLVSAGSDGIARLWDGDTGELLRALPHDRKLKSVEFTPDGSEIVTIDSAGEPHRWPLDPDSPKDVQPLIVRACGVLSRNQLTEGEWLKNLGETKKYRTTCP